MYVDCALPEASQEGPSQAKETFELSANSSLEN